MERQEVETVGRSCERARQSDGFRFVARGPRLILYLDSSAIVKQYVFERGSNDIGSAAGSAEISGTSILSRTEVAAAFKKAARMKAVDAHSAHGALRRFTRDWPGLVRIR